MGVGVVSLVGIIYSLASQGTALQGNLQLKNLNLLPKCVSLTVTPQEVKPKLPNTMGITDVTATVTFSDGKNYVTSLAWTGTNGTFSQPTEVKRSSNLPFINPFIVDGSGNPASVTVKVTSIVGAQNSPACQGGVTIKTPYTPTADNAMPPTSSVKPVADPCADLKAKIDNGTATPTDTANYQKRCQEKPPVVDPCIDLKTKVDNGTATSQEIDLYEKRCKPFETPQPTPQPLPPVTYSPAPPTGQTPPPPTSTTPPPPTTPTSEPTPPPTTPPTPPTGSTGTTTAVPN